MIDFPVFYCGVWFGWFSLILFASIYVDEDDHPPFAQPLIVIVGLFPIISLIFLRLL